MTYVTNQTEVYTDSCVDIVPASSAVLCTISQILGLTDASRSPKHYTHRLGAVEVSKGYSSLLQGPNQMGGAINIPPEANEISGSKSGISPGMEP
ncbi:hypothetical protein EsCd1KSP079_01502 [Escherichia sp. KS167_9B]|nr:hypothetical protein EsCd1KSP079_01502 [Escherichia sp. KS167_9B]